MPKKGLGKGLGSIFGDTNVDEITSDNKPAVEGDIANIRMSLIEPNKKQPRRLWTVLKL